ncbi:MAG: cytochrome c3 family protein, partial [Thermoanaerobaculia bacterium]|nr:cytochrome c3 family protein [Thermoanaerobaculia bacterium]
PFLRTRQNALAQPVPFSHQHHVTGLGLDCRYCHTSVEDSSFAGIPPTQTCMNCHSQIWTNADMLEPVRESWRTNTPLIWNRVHRLADFVRFNHSIHVNNGIGCVSCHGRVDQMPLVQQVEPLTMSWCLDCHRNPEKFIRPQEKVFDTAWESDNQKELGERLVDEYGIRKLQHCSTCHY